MARKVFRGERAVPARDRSDRAGWRDQERRDQRWCYQYKDHEDHHSQSGAHECSRVQSQSLAETLIRPLSSTDSIACQRYLRSTATGWHAIRRPLQVFLQHSSGSTPWPGAGRPLYRAHHPSRVREQVLSRDTRREANGRAPDSRVCTLIIFFFNTPM